MEERPNKYTIEKITDIFQIPESKFEDFLVDFKAYYQLGRSFPKALEELARVGGVEAQVVPTKMVWIDDGEHEARINITHRKVEDGKASS